MPRTRELRTALGHLVVIAVVFTGYKLGRLQASDDLASAQRHGERVWHLERWLHLPSERSLQSLALHSHELVRVINGYYKWAHWTAAISVLVWLFLHRRAHYLWAVWSLGLSMAAALVLHLAMPTAPPRLLGSHGIVDTGTVFGQSPYGDPAQVGYGGQLLAMPSLHAGWSLLLAVVLVSAYRGRARWLWFLHPLATVLVIVITGNHYWLDAVVGWAICGAALLVSRRWTVDRQPARELAPPALSPV